MRVIISDSNNNLLGQPDYTRFNKLPRYKKLYAFFNRKYKRKYVDFKGCKIEGLLCENFTIDGEEVDCCTEINPGEYQIMLNNNIVQLDTYLFNND